jgi:hypothetical protein
METSKITVPRNPRRSAPSLTVNYDHRAKKLQLTVRGTVALIIVGICILIYVALEHGS